MFPVLEASIGVPKEGSSEIHCGYLIEKNARTIVT